MVAGIEMPRWLPFAGLLFVCAVAGLIAGVRPMTAIGLALGLAFVLVAFQNLTAGLVAFALISFLEFVLPSGSALTLTKLAGLMLAISWLAKIATGGRRDELLLTDRPLIGYLLAAFLTWSFLSLLWAPDTGAGIDVLQRYLLVFVLFMIVFTAVRTPGHVAWLVAVFIIGCAITAAYALVFRPTTEANVLRVTSTVGNPNVLASILVAGLVLSLGAAAAWRRSLPVVIGSLIAATLCVGGMFLTGSRSGAVAFGAALVVAVIVAGRWRWQALLAAMALALTVTVSFLAFVPTEARERVTDLSAGQQRVPEGRTTLWQVGAKMFNDRPVLGVGVGNFQEASLGYVLDPGVAARTDLVIDDPQVAHNVYLQVAAELGLPGIALFLSILGYAVVSSWRAAARFARAGDGSMEIIARALIVAVVAILVTDFFASEQFNKLLWLLLGLGPALLAIAERQPVEEAAPAQRRLAVGRPALSAR